MADNNTEPRYQKVKEQLLADGLLFEDPDFPAVDESISYSRRVPSNVKWRRPKEICANPQFVVDGTSRFDLDQGDLGNCWFIAAAATIAMKRKLLKKVVPLKQDFDDGYAGIFRFNFWQYGEWQEVVVDDRLPVKDGAGLVFCRNREEPNEFWSALLEKAYAKLYGSYEALAGGKIQDALVDFTGGAGEVIPMGNKRRIPKKLFNWMLKCNKMNSLMGCTITSPGSFKEEPLPNGLYKAHAYSITGLTKFNVDGNNVRLVRLRNPWGKYEWKGAWSDGSPEWDTIRDKKKERLGVTYEEDGEFWMSYEDWVDNFNEMQVCHLTPQGTVLSPKKKRWEMALRHSAWVKGESAGGSGNPPDQGLYWTNPQFHFTLSDPDEDDDKNCTVIISLMQKYQRLLKKIKKKKVPTATLR